MYTIEPKKTALLLIDVQEEYFNKEGALYIEHAREEILDNLVLLKNLALKVGITPIIVQHVHNPDYSDVGRMGDFKLRPAFVRGTRGVDIIPELEVSASSLIIEKTRYSAFVNTKIESILKTRKIDTIIVTGLMTNFCCVTTARHAHDLDYKVIFVKDANTGPDMPDLGFGQVSHLDIIKSVSTSLAARVARIASTQELVNELG